MARVRVDKKVKAPQQYESYDYEKFQFVGANRELSEYHVKEVMDEISNKDLCDENPVKVDKTFNIMEGQHTVIAYERLEMPVRYIFTRMTVDDIGRFNMARKTWRLTDVLNHYCVRGFEDYTILYGFYKKYHYPISTLIILLSGEHTKKLYKEFKFGEFKVKQSIAQVQDILNKISEFKPFNKSVFRNKTFVLTYIDVLTHPEFDHDIMVHKVSVVPDRFKEQKTQRDYLLMLEEIYNYRNKNQIRLY